MVSYDDSGREFNAWQFDLLSHTQVYNSAGFLEHLLCARDLGIRMHERAVSVLSELKGWKRRPLRQMRSGGQMQ